MRPRVYPAQNHYRKQKKHADMWALLRSAQRRLAFHAQALHPAPNQRTPLATPLRFTSSPLAPPSRAARAIAGRPTSPGISLMRNSGAAAVVEGVAEHSEEKGADPPSMREPRPRQGPTRRRCGSPSRESACLDCRRRSCCTTPPSVPRCSCRRRGRLLCSHRRGRRRLGEDRTQSRPSERLTR